MFNNLVESGSHGRDLKRKGSFFIGTFLFYTVLLAVAGVGSIYAYNVRLDEQNDYVLTIVRFPTAQQKTEPVERRAEPRAAASRGGTPKIATIKDLVLDRPLPGRQVAAEGARVLRPGTPFKFGDVDDIPAMPSGGVEHGPIGLTSTKVGTGGPVVNEPPEEAPPVKAKSTPTPEPRREDTPVRVSSVILSGKATYKPAPPYPVIAKQIKQQGTVAVQIVVDEQGRVVSAKASSGPPLLLQAAVQAAYQARFSPTTLNGQPVKISGVITYNFVLQ